MNYLDTFRRHAKLAVLSVLLVANIFVWVRVYGSTGENLLQVHFLDVGQGDAVLIETPSGKRVLIDGGPNRGVLSELGKVLPFGETKIDIVIGTHPDRDHIGGLPEVVSRYDVGAYIHPGVRSKNTLDEELDNRIKEKGIDAILARRGMVVDFQDGAKLVILFPDRDVSGWETNSASVIAKLIYGGQSFLLTGDAPIKTENILASLGKEILDSSVLKVGHHGSRTSTSRNFVNIVTPDYAVISAGRDNSYGHPHIEVLNNLSSVSSAILSTVTGGTITIQTDGKEMTIK